MSKPWQPYALNILDAIAKIQRIRMRGDIAADEALYDVALRDLQTLSEATQLLPDDRKAAFPNIPWQEISSFRNILVHNYLGDIDPLTVCRDRQESARARREYPCHAGAEPRQRE